MIINAYTWSRPPKYCTLLCYRAHSQCEFFLLRGNIVLLTFLGVFIIMAGWSCNDYSFHSNISFFCNCSIFNYLSNYPYCDCDHIIIIHLNFLSNKNFSFLLFICKSDVRKKIILSRDILLNSTLNIYIYMWWQEYSWHIIEVNTLICFIPYSLKSMSSIKEKKNCLISVIFFVETRQQNF